MKAVYKNIVDSWQLIKSKKFSSPCPLSFVTFLLLIFSSCEKEIRFPVKEKDKRIVIEAELGTLPGSTYVRLSETINIYENQFPKLSGAVITIADEEGNITLLNESQTGYYTHPTFAGIPQKKYIVNVMYKGENYKAESRVASGGFIEELEVFGEEWGEVNIVALINDNPNEANYYLMRVFINENLVSMKVPFDDTELDFNEYWMTAALNESTYVFPGDSITVQLLNINKEMYDFYVQLFSVSMPEYSGFFQLTAPDNPVSNINNKALGYFSAHTIDQKTYVIP